MDTLINILSLLIAVEFLYIMYLESFANHSGATQKTFSMSREELAHPKVNLLLSNQGAYNGFLALGILYALYAQFDLLMPILIYIILVAAYGAFSSKNWMIFVKQASLAVITLILILMN
ncbi:DUF1304 domain-containing protein [Eupransor demetentiae]|uniref:Uncharacterized membrane protein n=1 Tax=Eupransor demetentiae TaxID=3109584 RepID=A0ABM9N5M3_9LACO|nr:Uncharacterized membrane protein [Lactobacillaceae bacterium LMG 33000]